MESKTDRETAVSGKTAVPGKVYKIFVGQSKETSASTASR